jgi:predicted extracellular nuclease
MKSIKLVVSVIAISVMTACGGGAKAPPGAPTPSTGTTVAAIQGTGSASPLNGQAVTLLAIVTGDFQDNDADTSSNLGGFYVQQEIPDADSLTSDGIFIFDGDNPATAVNVGDRVEVSGTVNEYFGETQVNATTVRVTGSGVIFPTAEVTTNSDGEAIADLERYEGMLLRLPQKLAVSNLRFLERYGEVGLAAGGRPFQFTNGSAPDVSGYATHKKTLAARSLILDDGMRSNNPSTLPPFGI